MMPTGNVEVWLGEVERRMRMSVRHQVRFLWGVLALLLPRCSML